MDIGQGSTYFDLIPWVEGEVMLWKEVTFPGISTFI